MKLHSTPARGPLMTWVGAGLGITILGIVMIPVNVLTAVGVGCIIGGISVIVAAFMRNHDAD